MVDIDMNNIEIECKKGVNKIRESNSNKENNENERGRLFDFP